MGFEKAIRTCCFGESRGQYRAIKVKQPLSSSSSSSSLLIRRVSSTTIFASTPTSVFLSVAYISVILSHPGVFLLKATLSQERHLLSLKWLKYPDWHCGLIRFQFVKQLVTSISDTPPLSYQQTSAWEEDPGGVNHGGIVLPNWHYTEAVLKWINKW